MRKKATDTEIYSAILGYRDEHGYSPSVRDICKIVGISSTSTMHNRLASMEYKGMLSGSGGRARAIVPLPFENWSEDAKSDVLRADEQKEQEGRPSAARRA
ncbi:MAG: hypothetical protein J6D54_04740 [Olsenella sp.]|nr:hypothetical protein [Olsenella sp.]